MKISECTYCGMLAITDRDICTSCAALIAPAAEPADQTAAQPASNPFQPAPNSDDLPPTPPNRRSFPGSYQAAQSVSDSKCGQCQTAVLRGQSRCFDCENKKSSPFKRLAVAAFLVAVIGFLSFDYVYEQVSPHGIFRKYAKTTGADDSLIFENFVLQGETYISTDSAAGFSTGGFTGKQHTMEVFSFKMIFKKPNISSVEFLRAGASGSQTAFKQVFDGTRGWKYTNMPNQPAGYQDTDDAFASKKLGMGMDEYDSLEFMNAAAAQTYGKDNINALANIKEIEVADIKKPSGEKIFVLGKQKHNGTIESSLLVFDQQTGLLLGIIKRGLVKNVSVTTIIYLNKYAKFQTRRKGWFGVEDTRVLVPTKMSFVTKTGDPEPIKTLPDGMPVVSIELNIKTVEIDAPLEDSYFQKQ